MKSSSLHRPIILIAAFLLSPAHADPPVDYYDPAIGTAGALLKSALHEIIKGHTALPYTSTATDTWDALKILDEDAANSSNVMLVYSGWSVAKSEQYNGVTGTWDREHLWPQSFGLVARSPNSRAKTDLFNLRSVDSTVNGNRGNKEYDISTSPFAIPPEAPSSSYDVDSWEPRDADKGPIARALFYMAVRYDGSDADAPDLELSDVPNAALFVFGKLSTVLAWNRQFPVTAEERLRNDRIYLNFQGNRNPFIDHPGFADMVFIGATPAVAWKNARFTAAELANPMFTSDDADPDRDGIPNLLEYTFNRNPKASEQSALLTTEVFRQGGLQYFYLTFPHNRYATDVQIGYERSSDLRTWVNASAEFVSATVTDFETEEITVRVPANQTRLFVRLKATK